MKTVMDMARESGFLQIDVPELFERFAALVREDEREACALVCNRMDWRGRSDEAIWKGEAADECATAIRARGEK